MDDPKILALDLATTIGWALGRPLDVPRAGAFKLGKKDGSTGGRYRTYRKWLNLELVTHHIDIVVMEAPAKAGKILGRNPGATRFLIGLCEHTEEVCHDRVELREATVKDVRMHFIGSNPRGDVGKIDVQRKCRSIGWDFEEDDNAADALALWSYMRSQVRPELALVASPLFQPLVGKR